MKKTCQTRQDKREFCVLSVCMLPQQMSRGTPAQEGRWNQTQERKGSKHKRLGTSNTQEERHNTGEKVQEKAKHNTRRKVSHEASMT